MPSRSKSPTGFTVQMPAPPPHPSLTPFARQVCEMEVCLTSALIFPRTTEKSQLACVARCASAISAAKKRDLSKRFVMRAVTVRGTPTFAVWRVK
jgi:hypothetical protein